MWMTILMKNKYYLILGVNINIKMLKIWIKLIRFWLLGKEGRKEEFNFFMRKNFSLLFDCSNLKAY